MNLEVGYTCSCSLALPGAIIFDLDQTLIDSRPQWRYAEICFLKLLGLDPQMSIHHLYNGMNARDAVDALYTYFQPLASVENCRHVFRKSLILGFSQMPIKVMPGVEQLIRHYYQRVPMVIASGSPQEGIDAAVTAIGVDNYLHGMLSSESVPRGKPYPDVFLAAARMLDMPPEQCLVFEDSLVGAQAAVAAGMHCIVTPSQPKDDFANLEVCLIDCLTQVDDQLIQQNIAHGT